MKKLIRFAAATFALAAVIVTVTPAHAKVPLNGLTESEERSGWQLLFDGTTTDGWRNYQSDTISDGWVVENGVLSRVNGGAGDIVTEEEFEHFELALEYRISKGGNSGIMFHVAETEPKPWQTGPEIQIQDNVHGRDPQKAGWLYQLYKPTKPGWVRRFEQQVGLDSPDVVEASRPAGEWNHVYLRVTPQQCEVALNGVSYYKFRKGSDDWDKRVADSKFSKYPNFGKPTKGHICLQDHGNLVSFRNIKVRKLPADGSAPNPIDNEMPLKIVNAFPDIEWTDWEGVDERGRPLPLRPIVLTSPGDNSKRLFVATQSGVIHVFDKKPQADRRKTVVFLDISEKVHDYRKDNEEGLLGLAFHPKYKDNGYFYVYYSSEQELHTSIVSRFKVRDDDPNRADSESEHVVMKIEQPFANHNGGSIIFARDGMLYIGLGDGGSRNDPLVHGQNVNTLLGSILRIDVDGRDGDKNYAIPEDNPFVNREGAAPEIFAYGFRNVWRLTEDRETGTLWAADVGQDLWEEINIVERGGNYGWNVREASYPFGNLKLAIRDRVIDPIWEYDHNVGKSITGGYVYRGSRLPELYGAYVYADYVSGKVWALRFDEATGKMTKNLAIPSRKFPVLAFGEDYEGEVYCLVESGNGESVFRFERDETAKAAAAN